MNHLEAVQLSAVEQYLLNDLSPDVRDAFEEHYFDCRECTDDLRTASAFMDAARQEFTTRPVVVDRIYQFTNSPAVTVSQAPPTAMKTVVKNHSTIARLFSKPAILVPALAASLLVIGYQNAVVYPQLQNQVATSHAPEILPRLSLAANGSRSDQLPTIEVKAGQPYLLAVDIPTDGRFASYVCELHAPSGNLVWRLPVTAKMAEDQVTIQAPALNGNGGRYFLVVNGSSDINSTKGGIELSRGAFNLTIQQ